jgi:hypothetical protein
MLDLTVLLQPWISRTPGAGKFLYIHHTVLICTVGLLSIPKDEKAPQKINASTQMKSRNGYVPRMHFFRMKYFTNWYIAMISV